MNSEKLIIYFILIILLYKTFFVSENMTDIERKVEEIYKSDVKDIEYITKNANKLAKNNEFKIDKLTVKELHLDGITLKNNGDELTIKNKNTKISFKVDGSDALIKAHGSVYEGIFFNKPVYYGIDNRPKNKCVLDGESLLPKDDNSFHPNGDYQKKGQYELDGDFMTSNIADAHVNIVEGTANYTAAYNLNDGYLTCAGGKCSLYDKNGSRKFKSD